MAPAEASAARVAADPRTAREVDGGRRLRRADVLVAVATAVVSLALLLGLPYLDAVDPDTIGHRSRLPRSAAPTGPRSHSGSWSSPRSCWLLVDSRARSSSRSPPSPSSWSPSPPAGTCSASPRSPSSWRWCSLPSGCRSPALAVGRRGAALVSAGTAGNWIELNGLALSAVPSDALGDALPQGVTQAIGAVGLPLVVALVVRSRREVRAARDAEVAARTAEASAAVREQDARVDAAVSRERAAMARELHDIAAHHLSGIALMSAVIDRQIDTDPTAAHEGVRQVREQSTAVLEDLRRLVGLLRDDAPAERAVETVAGIVDLVERARYRSDVRLEVLRGAHEVAEGVGPLAQLAAYRTAQEALANAALHAPGAVVTVTLDDRAVDHLELTVENAAPAVSAPSADAPAGPGEPTPEGPGAGGNGLRGMRERADLVGARLQTGTTPDGGWVVTLRLGRETPEVTR